MRTSGARGGADHTSLDRVVERQAIRLARAARDRRSALSATVFLGTLGLVFVLPVVAGAYLGRWLDESVAGYSIRWTLSLISLGVVVGALNVYYLFRESDDGR